MASPPFGRRREALIDDEPQRLRAGDHLVLELIWRQKARHALHRERDGLRVDRRRRRMARYRRMDRRTHVLRLSTLADDDVRRLAPHRPFHEGVEARQIARDLALRDRARWAPHAIEQKLDRLGDSMML